MCTLSHECFEKIEKDFVADMEGVHEHNDEALHLATASKLVLASEAVANIKLFLEKRKTTTKKNSPCQMIPSAGFSMVVTFSTRSIYNKSSKGKNYVIYM